MHYVPRGDGEVVWLPGGLPVHRGTSGLYAVWELGTTSPQPIAAFRATLNAGTFESERHQSSLSALLSGVSQEQRDALVYAGFIIDHFYLQQQTVTVLQADCAARLALLLLDFWNVQAKSEDAHLTHLAEIAIPMLWRCYWSSLDTLLQRAQILRYLPSNDVVEGHRLPLAAQPPEPLRREDSPLAGWRDHLEEEHARALRMWQRICFQDEHSWFFSDWLCEWRRVPSRTWQKVREDEVHTLVWQDRSREILRSPGVKTPGGRRRLAYIAEQWYLPRYDIHTARRVRAAVARAEHDRLTVLTLRWFGIGRLGAGIGVGYAVTALQSDTWRTLANFVVPQQHYGLAPAALLGISTITYLAAGVFRKTRVSGAALYARIAYIVLHGELFAVMIGYVVLYFLHSTFLTSDKIPPGGQVWVIPWLYAQLAFFIGTFTQLIFDAKSVTAPLDPP